MPAESRKTLVVITVVCVVAMVWISYWRMMSESRRALQCVGHLRAISAAASYYILRHDRQTPSSMKSLLEHPGVDLKTFICPASGSDPEPGRFVSDYDSLFGRIGRSVSFLSIDSPSQTPMIWDREAVHNDGSPYRHVIFADGSLRRMHEEEFQAALKRLPGSGPATD